MAKYKVLLGSEADAKGMSVEVTRPWRFQVSEWVVFSMTATSRATLASGICCRVSPLVSSASNAWTPNRRTPTDA